MLIKNKLSSPFELIDKHGKKVILPANGEVEIEPGEVHLERYRQVGYFEIVDSGKKSETKSDNEDLFSKTEADSLRADYEDLAGKPADKRWSESRLQSEIDALMESEGE